MLNFLAGILCSAIAISQIPFEIAAGFYPLIIIYIPGSWYTSLGFPIFCMISSVTAAKEKGEELEFGEILGMSIFLSIADLFGDIILPGIGWIISAVAICFYIYLYYLGAYSAFTMRNIGLLISLIICYSIFSFDIYEDIIELYTKDPEIDFTHIPLLLKLIFEGMLP